MTTQDQTTTQPESRLTPHPSRNTQYVIRPYNAAAVPDVIPLVQQVLGAHKTPDFWRWKHHQNPFGLSCGLYAWDEDERIAAGLRVFLRWRFRDPDGQDIRAVRAVDTVTHPAYRRQGIFSTLTRQAVDDLIEEGVHLIFNTPNRRTSLPGYLKLGWHVVAAWPLYVRMLNPLRTALRVLRRGRATGRAPAFESYFGTGIATWKAFVACYKAVLPALVAAWEEGRRAVGFRTPRGPAYLNWRYGQHSRIQYGVYALEDGEGLAGFAVLRPNRRYGLKEIVLTEMFLREPDAGLGRLLLKGMFKHLRGDYLVAHFGQGTVERELLGWAGFVRVPLQGILFTVRPLAPAPQSALAPAGWDLCLGDLEIF